MTDSARKKISKIWIAMSTPFQANFFASLIDKVKNEYEFLVTGRDHDSILRILEAKHINYVAVGTHGGRELAGKLEAYARNIQEMLPIVKEYKPDLLLTERWPEAVRVAFGFDIPSWTIFYDEREKFVNRMVFPLSSKVFAPRFYSLADLSRSGVDDSRKIVWFNGFHTCYLKDQPMVGKDPYERVGLKHPIVLVRPEPEFAAFFPHQKRILENTTRLLCRDKLDDGSEFNMAVLPRNSEQAKRYSEMGVRVLDDSISDCPVAHVDLALGAAETMLMEAVTLCKPAISCIYWDESKPVVELHKHVPHATDPEVIQDLVQKYLIPEEQQQYKNRMKLVVSMMDNPVDLMIKEIHRFNGESESGQKGGSKRRSRLEMLLDVIQTAAAGPCKPTHMMKAANISYGELRPIIRQLEKKGLVNAETTYEGRIYQATLQGLELLRDYYSFRSKIIDE